MCTYIYIYILSLLLLLLLLSLLLFLLLLLLLLLLLYHYIFILSFPFLFFRFLSFHVILFHVVIPFLHSFMRSFVHSFIHSMYIAWTISMCVVSVVVNRWFGTGPRIHSSICHLECEQNHQICFRKRPNMSQGTMRSRSRSGGTAVTPSSHRGGTPASCFFVLVPCSIPKFQNLTTKSNKVPNVSATGSFKVKFRSRTAFDKLDS